METISQEDFERVFKGKRVMTREEFERLKKENNFECGINNIKYTDLDC